MPSCREIDPLLAPYIDGEIALADKAVVAAHLTACPPCRQRAEAETAAGGAPRSGLDTDPPLAPYRDGEIALADKAVVAAHLTACPPCRQRAEAETAARETLRSRMSRPCAPEHLRKRCRKAASPIGRITSTYSASSLSMVAVLVVVGGGVSVYGLTRFSPTVLAAQLTI